MACIGSSIKANSYPSYLETTLNLAEGDKYEVINAGLQKRAQE